MEKRGVLNRNLSKENYSWLNEDLAKGKVVYEYLNYTYNCIGPNGIAISDEKGEGPFYEVPKDAVDWV